MNIFGKTVGSEKPGAYKPGDVVGRSKGLYDDFAGSSLGMRKMKQGLGGYTSDEEQKIFDRGRARTESAQRSGMRGLGKELSRSGIGGGLGGNFMANLAGTYGKQAGQQSQDLSIANIDKKDQRLADYFGAEKSMRGYATGLAQEEEAGKRYAHEDLMRKYGMDPERKDPGLIGALANRAGVGDMFSGLFG